MPTVSLQTITATFNGERTELRDTILTPELVESLGEQPGVSSLIFGFQTEGAIPADGFEVTVSSDIDLTDYFRGLSGSPLTAGGEVLGAVYDDDGAPTGFRLLITSPNALVSLNLENKEEVETDGPEMATFTLEGGSGVDIGTGSSTVTFYDSLETAPTSDGGPQVSLNISETALIESEGNTTTLTFDVDGEVPSDGILVYVNSVNGNFGDLGEFDVFSAEISGGTVPFANFAANGFYFKILEDGASITLPAFDETTNPEIEEGIVEGIQSFNFELVDGPGYDPDPDASSISLTIADDADSQLQVSYFVEPAALIESEGTVGAHIFELSSPPPEEGVTVTVSAPNLGEFDLDSIEVEGGEIVGVSDDGFEFNITSQSATINLPVADDGEDEGLEEAVFTVEPGEGYQVNPDASMGVFTLVDTPDQIPAPMEVGEPNDTIELAVSSGLSATNPEVSFDSSIDYENSNRYELEDGNLLYVDFTEDVDLYSFNLEAGDTVVLDTDASQTNLEEPSGLDTVLRLFDDAGNELAISDDDGAPNEVFVASRDSYIEYTAETSGTYYVGVSSFPNGEFDFDNNPYEPDEPASGTGRSSGEYTLNLSLNTDSTAEATVITPGDGSGPTIGLQAIEGTFNGERTELRDTVLAPNLVEFLGEQPGASILSLALDIDGTIPAEGVEVIINSDFNLTDYFGSLSRSPFTLGGEVVGAVYDDAGMPSGIRFLATSPNALIGLNLDEPEEAGTDGPDVLNFTLESSEGYVVDEDAAAISATVYDTLDDVPAPTSEPTVGISISETNLIESEGTEVTFSFDIEGEIPEEGVLIYADTGERAAIGEFNIFAAEIEGGVFPNSNFVSSGFYFRAFEDGASLTLNVFDETLNPEIDPEAALEGVEDFTLSLVEGPGYMIDADNAAVSYTISDNPDSVPLPDDEGGDDDEGEMTPPPEPNDTVDTAIDTGLSGSVLSYSTVGEIGSSFQTRNLVDASEDVDMYSFELMAGETISVDVDSIEYFLEDDPELADVPQRFDSELRLFDAEGNELLLNTSGAAPDEIFNAGRDAYLEYTAEETGTYYVGVAQFGNQTYDPFEAGLGSGRIFPAFGINIGEYTIDINLTTDEAPNQPSDRNDILNGEGGDDVLAGLLGDDMVFGNDGDDTLRGDLDSRDPGGMVGGDDTLSGGAGNDQIGGKGGNDLLSGDAGDDMIWGDDGNDTIMGVTGNDTLTGDDFSGGSGSDLFVFGNGDGTDTITDFNPAEDMIGLVEGELMFEDIEIITIDGDAAISMIESGETLAILDGVDADELTADMFVITPDVTFG